VKCGANLPANVEMVLLEQLLPPARDGLGCPGDERAQHSGEHVPSGSALAREFAHVAVRSVYSGAAGVRQRLRNRRGVLDDLACALEPQCVSVERIPPYHIPRHARDQSLQLLPEEKHVELHAQPDEAVGDVL